MVDLAGPRLLELLRPATAEWLASIARRRDYSDGETIHTRGDTDPSVSIVISGHVRMSRLRPDGTVSFVSKIGPGQHFGDVVVLAQTVRTHNVTAVGAVSIDNYDRAAFDRMLEKSEIVLALYRINSARLVSAISMVDDLRTLSREAHLAKLLLILHNRSGSSGSVEVVQEDLAAILGVSPMTLAKSLARLKHEKLIETRYRRIDLPDPERLRDWLTAQATD